MRHFALLLTLLTTTACQEKHATLDIASAKAKSALALSALECSYLAGSQADASRLFNVGVSAGREFLHFADSNASGYQSIASQIDPIWPQVAARPSADFKLGEINAATINRVRNYRGGSNERNWNDHRNALFNEKNCAFLGTTPPKA